jgi:hypothetical protein
LRRVQLTLHTPPLTVSRGDLLHMEPRSREVPLGFPSGGASRRRIPIGYYITIEARFRCAFHCGQPQGSPRRGARAAALGVAALGVSEGDHKGCPNALSARCDVKHRVGAGFIPVLAVPDLAIALPRSPCHRVTVSLCHLPHESPHQGAVPLH